MGVIPRAVVEEKVAAELAAATAWARRQGLQLDTDVAGLRLWLRLSGPGPQPGAPSEDYLLEGQFDDYPALPPVWRFVDPRTREAVGAPAFPRPKQPAQFGSPLVIDGAHAGILVCAHFNRLAYADHGGIHPNWGAATSWRTPQPNYTIALDIAAMLDRIYREMPHTVGRWAPLPEAA